MAVKFAYGDYEYPNCTITDCTGPVESRLRLSERPARHGVFSQGGLAKERRIVLTGLLELSDGETIFDLDTRWGLLNASHSPGASKVLFAGRDDLYTFAEVEAVRDVNARDYPTAIPFEIAFVANEPFWFGTGTQSFSLASGNVSGDSAVVAGTIESPLVVEFGITAIGTITPGETYPPYTSKVAIANTTTGNSVSIWARALETVRFDSERETVERWTGSAWQSANELLLAGEQLTVLPEQANNLFRQAYGGAATGNTEFVWRPRWW